MTSSTTSRRADLSLALVSLSQTDKPAPLAFVIADRSKASLLLRKLAEFLRRRGHELERIVQPRIPVLGELRDVGVG